MHGNWEVDSVYHVKVKCLEYEKKRQLLIQAVRAEVRAGIFDDWYDDERKEKCMCY